jgi:ribulose-5-phosphate 4-epimerase/fuculose-1-phosphate aldolase
VYKRQGQDPLRYDGAGYGNVSMRTGPFPGRPGARPFLITGTQTGGMSCLDLTRFAWVQRYDIAANAVRSQGSIRPSSESMTHGAVYDLSPRIRVVLHIHCADIWLKRAVLRLPTTRPGVDYGTIAMAREVRRLAQDAGLLDRRVFAMDAHEDGIVAFGRDCDEAGAVLLSTLAKAHALRFGDDGRVCAFGTMDG